METEFKNKANSIVLNSKVVTLLFIVYFLFTPLDFAFAKILPGGAPLKYIGIIIIFSALFYGLKNNLIIRIKLPQIAMGLWVLLGISSLFWIQRITPTSIAYLVNYISFVTLFIIATIFFYSDKQIKMFLNATMIGSTVASIIALINPTIFEGSANRFSISLFGVENDPNEFAINITFGIIIALYNILTTKKYRGLNFLIMGINIVALFLSGSRSGLVSVLVASSVMIFGHFFSKPNIKDISKKSLWIIITFLLGMVAINFFVPDYLKERVLDIEEYTTGSGRTQIWSVIFKWILDKPIFGYGVGSLESLGLQYFGVYRAAHNIYLNILIELGFVGFFLFQISITSIINAAKKYKKYNAIAILSIGLISSLFLEGSVKRFLWNSIMLSSMIINNANISAVDSKLNTTIIAK